MSIMRHTLLLPSSKRAELEWGVDGFLIFDVNIIPAAIALTNQLIPGDHQHEKIPAEAANISASDLLSIPEVGENTRTACLFILK